MREVQVDVDAVRVFLHVLGAAVWVGGQIVLGALVPVLRAAGVDGLPRQAARRFGMVAWPFFALAVVTGIWNLLELPAGTATSYQVALAVKLLLVAVSGSAAALHSTTPSPVVRAVTGGAGLLAALGALFTGVLLAV
jgi:putative copper export protein